MSLRFDMKLEGGDSINNVLDRLPGKIGEKVLKQSMRAATRPMVRMAKSFVPVKSGTLRKAIRVKDSRKRVAGNHAVLFGADKTAPHAHLVEFGTQPHVIQAKPGGWLRIFGSFAKSVQHPGTRARPFIRPAFDAGKGKWFTDLGEQVGKRVIKEVKKLRKL